MFSLGDKRSSMLLEDTCPFLCSSVSGSLSNFVNFLGQEELAPDLQVKLKLVLSFENVMKNEQ